MSNFEYTYYISDRERFFSPFATLDYDVKPQLSSSVTSVYMESNGNFPQGMNNLGLNCN